MLLICDVDGVMTDGTVTYTVKKEPHTPFYPITSRNWSVRDGHGIQMWLTAGHDFLMLSGSDEFDLHSRARKFFNLSKNTEGDFNAYFGVSDKFAFIQKHFPDTEYAAIGDDVMDIPLLDNAVWAFCPIDAEPEVKRHVASEWKGKSKGIVLQRAGGDHCVREVINSLLFIYSFDHENAV